MGSVCTIDARFSLSSVPSPPKIYFSPLKLSLNNHFCFNSLFKYLTLRNTLRLSSKNYRSLQPYIIYFLEIISINYFLNCIFIELKTSMTQVFPKMKHYILNYLFYMTPLLHYQELFHLMVVLTVVHF